MNRRVFITRTLRAALAAPFLRFVAPVVQIMRWNRRDEVTLSPLNRIALKDSIRLTERVCRTLARNNPYMDLLKSKPFENKKLLEDRYPIRLDKDHKIVYPMIEL